jgi:beta-1,2-mannosidase
MKNTYIAFILILLTSCSQGKKDWDFSSFYKPDVNPVIKADSTYIFKDPVKGTEVRWQRADVFNPAAIVAHGKVFLLLRCEDNPAAILGGRTSRIGLASSDDGLHFTKYPEPVLYPDSGKFMQYDYPGGCEDPRVVQTDDSVYVMTYTSWNYKVARLSVAFSHDLLKWEKKGPAFAKAANGKFLDNWSKSASIVTELKNGSIVAARIKGKYWMYWGEQFINLAWSKNLYDWYPLTDENGELKKIAVPRPGKFDSNLTECGPPAIINKEGIVLFYNGKNDSGEAADKTLPASTYSVGRIVFDPENPEKILSRSDTCLLKPSLPHEITGQYSAGTTFSEGLVYFKSKWFLYYGTADSFVGVAVSKE